MPASTDPAIVERAFQLWAFVFTRNCEAVARHLRDGIDGTGDEVVGPVAIAARTVRTWEQRDRWAERVDTEMHRLAPAMWRTVHSTIMQGSIEAARFIRELVTQNDGQQRLAE